MNNFNKYLVFSISMFLFGILGSRPLQAEDSAPTHIIEVAASTQNERNQIVNLGYSLEEFRSDKVFFYGKPSDAAKLARLGFKTKSFSLKKEWLRLDALSQEPGTGGLRYHSYDEVTKSLKQLETDHPDIVSMLSMGRSLENRDVPMLRISAKSLAEAEALHLPVAFYMGCHHAREHLSVEVPLKFAQHLVAQYGHDADVTRLLNTREIYVAPIVNPDGHVYDYSDGIRGRMWRKNRRPNSDGSSGVDLNRNYGFQWGTGGSSTDPHSEVYMGPEAFSEVETRNVKAFVDSQPRMTTLLTVHTFSELILYPWGHSNSKIGEGLGKAEDLPVFEKMAKDMSSWNHYTPEQSSSLYIASGDTVDWAYGTHGIFAFTFELTPASQWDGGFYPNPSVIDPTFNANIKPMMYMLEYADNPHRVLTEKRPSFEKSPARQGISTASFADIQF